MLFPVRSAQFKRDVKRAEKRGKDMKKLRSVILLLISGDEPPSRLQDHPLRGRWSGYRDIHIEPDWLLIYRVVGEHLHLTRTGSHSDIFDD